MKFIYILFLSFLYHSLFSQTTFSVEESDYKNQQIVFYAYSDYITFSKDTIALVYTDEKGAFSSSIEITTIRQIFVDLGVYHCSFYAEQKKEYTLKLPKKRIKTKVEELNIYFEPIQVQLMFKEIHSKDLNKLITSFDDIYDKFLIQNFDSIYRFSQSKLIEKFEKDINNFYSEISHPFFKSYIDYKIIELKFLGPNRSYQTISFKYYNNKEIHYFNPAYMHLFNLMFKDLFILYSNTKEGRTLQNVVKEGRSIKKIIKVLDNNVAFSNPVLEELVALKGIHDELFNPRMKSQIHFNRPQMLIILDSLVKFSLVTEHKQIANNIIKKTQIDFKITGKNAPNFKFLSIDGVTKNLDDFKGKYIYLNFMRTDVVPAMENMDMMINFYKTHKEDIEIISVFTDKDDSNFFKLDTTKYNWPLFYIGENQEILDYYHLVTWPQFHLISPDGKILESPTPSLKENFEILFFDKIDTYKRN